MSVGNIGWTELLVVVAALVLLPLAVVVGLLVLLVGVARKGKG